MGQFGAMIADGGGVGLRYARRLLDTIPADRFARVAAPGGQAIHSNHPAFNIGHLTCYPVKIADLLGADPTGCTPPPSFLALFTKDNQCVDDPAGTIYPGKDEIVATFFRTYEAAFETLRACDDQQLLIPTPADSPLKHICPTQGSMLAFYAIGHVTSHLGQISTWRRMEGLPSA